MVAKRPYWSAPRWRHSNTTTTKTASLARARAPTTSTLLRSVVAASRSVTARILVELQRSSLTSVDAVARKTASLQRDPAEWRPPHWQLPGGDPQLGSRPGRSEEHTSELQSQ